MFTGTNFKLFSITKLNPIKIIKNGLHGENFLQNGILHSLIWFSQSLEIVLES